MKKLVIYLADLVHNYIPGNYVLPLNVGFVAAYVIQEFGDTVDVRLFKYPEDLMRAIEEQAPDLLGLSNYDWNFNLGLGIGKLYKTQKPDGIVAMGGPNIRTDRKGIQDFLSTNKVIDAYCMYQGEVPFANLVQNIFENGHFDRTGSVPGCAYLGPNAKLCYEEAPSAGKQLTTPSPFLTGILDPFLGNELIPLLETNRGCPYKCSFCTWGISAMDRVAYHSMDKVLAEFDYVAERTPQALLWILADANFGINKRDIKIAEHIGKIKKRNPKLRDISLWDAKNSGVRNLEVANKIGGTQMKLIGLQSLDPKVLKAIKRSNIKISELMYTVDELKKSGVMSSTDILVGLPEETRDSHVKTLRKCFDYGFDHIEAKHILLLQGSDMERDESRKEFGIKSKFRLKQGSFGIYGGVSAFEFEEGIRATDTISEDEMHEMRILHFLLWWGWNSGFIKPILTLLQSNGVNPVDVLVGIIQGDKSKYPAVTEMFDQFLADSKSEWFDTREEIEAHYCQTENLDKMLDADTTFSKLVFKYTALLIRDRDTRVGFLDYIADVCGELLDDGRVVEIQDGLNEIVEFLKELGLDIDVALQPELPTKQFVLRNAKAAEHVFNGAAKQVPVELELYVSKEAQRAIRDGFERFDVANNQQIAIEKILEIYTKSFIHSISAEGAM